MKHLIIEETKETIFDFSQETVKVFWMSSYDLALVALTVLRVSQFCFVLIQNQHKMTQYSTLNVKLSNSQLNK